MTEKMEVLGALQRAAEAMQQVNSTLMGFRAATLESLLLNAETVYLETYVAYRLSTTNGEHLLEVHQTARDYRDKLQQVKKLVDELDCEGDRLLQSVHASRS